MKPTQLAMKILHPIHDNDEATGSGEAIFRVTLFKEIMTRFATKLPETTILENILKREYRRPPIGFAQSLLCNKEKL